MKKLIDWWHRELLKLVAWASKIVSEIHMPYSRKLITGRDLLELRKLIRPGDIILSKTRGELGNVGVPGFYGHAAIVYDLNYVIEATTSGVIKTEICSFLLKKDYAALVRPTFAKDGDMLVAAREANRQVGKPYDYKFNTSDIASFYCSELVWWSYNQAMGVSPFKPREIFGRQTIVPQDFIDANKKFIQVWGSRSLQ